MRRELAAIIATAFCERVARRGGHCTGASDAGMAYLNCSYPRSRAAAHYGGRPRSRLNP